MSDFKGTPGPWEVESNAYYFSIESQGGGIGDVCMSGHVFDGGDCLGSTSKANASLIAAAPELLEALQEALPWVNNGLARGAHAKAVAAINKALRLGTDK